MTLDMTWTTRPRSDIGGLSAILAGEGPVILLVHGVGLRAEAWNTQIDVLSPKWRTSAIDLPGHGGSPLIREQSVLSDYTNAIAEVLEGDWLRDYGQLYQRLSVAKLWPSQRMGVARAMHVLQRMNNVLIASATYALMTPTTLQWPLPTLLLRRHLGSVNSKRKASLTILGTLRMPHTKHLKTNTRRTSEF